MGRKWLGTMSVIFVYVLASVLILGFAQGYTIDLQNKQLVTTGVLEVNTFPVQAQVLIDDVVVKEKTPVSLSHYIPGSYALRISLAGYQTVDLTTSVESHVVTRLRELPLWPELINWKNEAMPEDTIVMVKALPENGLFMVQTTNEISWWRPATDHLQKVLVIPITTKETVICGEKGEGCIVFGDERTVLVNTLELNYKVLTGTVVPKDNMHLFRFQNNYFLLSHHNNALTLEKIPSEGPVTQELIMQNINAFDLDGQDIWYVQNETLYRKSLISGLQQAISTLDKTVDNIAITTEYILVHTIEGEVFLWQRGSETVTPINTWHGARFFVNNNRILIISAAKVWLVDTEEGLLFVGQAPHDITFAQAYSSNSWLATMANGKVEMIMASPVGMYEVAVDTNQIAILPYQALVKWQDNALQYHFYPVRTWLKALTN